MPRNGTGTFTLVSGNPVVTGTTIESNWANTTLSDIATAMTDSLSRSGQGGMTAALRVADGSQGAPGVGFANETGSGFYRAGTGEVWAVVQGAQTLNLDANGVYVPADKTTTVDGAFVFNEAGADKDARFEGDTDANLLFVDASTDRVGIGTNTPATKLAVRGATQSKEVAVRWERATDGAVAGGLGYVYDSENSVAMGSVTNHPLKIVTNDTTRLTVDTAGNVGLGVTPNAWDANYKSVQVGTRASFSYSISGTVLGNNYFNDGAPKYIQSAAASALSLATDGSFQFLTAPVGTAGNSISFSQSATIDSAGLTLAATSDLYLNKGTANGVAYLNASKVLTTGGALNFNGTQLGINGTPSQALDVTANSGEIAAFRSAGGSANDKRLLITSGGNNVRLDAANQSGGAAEFAFSLNAAEGMRLTSTGLGIGTSSPGYKLGISGVATTYAASASIALYDTVSGVPASRNWLIGNVAAGNYGELNFAVSSAAGGAPTNSKMTLDSSGNLGLGVTPSAWSGASSNFQLVAGAFIATSSATARYGANYYYASAYKYTTSDYATLYQQSAGQHQWHTAPSWNGTGSDVISFTQAMTLDASGNLAIGETNAQGYRLNVNVGGSSTTRLANDALRLASNGSGADVNMNFTDGVANNAWIGMVGGNLYFDTGGTERARITSGGNFLINNTYSTASKLIVVGDGTSNAAYAASFADSTGASLLSLRNDGYIDTGTRAVSPYNNTTGSAANMYVDSAGGLYRSTSSLKYKTDVQDATHGLAEVLQLRPVTYKGKNDGDTVFGGLIAEEVHAAGLTEFVQYAPDGSPDALAYGNMVSLLTKAIQEQQAIITDLRARVAALEAQP